MSYMMLPISLVGCANTPFTLLLLCQGHGWSPHLEVPMPVGHLRKPKPVPQTLHENVAGSEAQ